MYFSFDDMQMYTTFSFHAPHCNCIVNACGSFCMQFIYIQYIYIYLYNIILYIYRGRDRIYSINVKIFFCSFRNIMKMPEMLCITITMPSLLCLLSYCVNNVLKKLQMAAAP